MSKYTIEELKKEYVKDSTYLTLKIKEKVTFNEGVGDQVGFYQETNTLEFSEDIDILGTEIREFLKTYFKNHLAILGFMRRILR